MTRIRFLRRQIESYSRLKEITKAIQLVALARLNSLSYKLKQRQTQLWVIKKVFQGVRRVGPELDVERYALVLVTTDRSSCGILNSNVFRVARALVDYISAQQKRARITTIGTKGKHFLRRTYPTLVKLCVTDVGSEPLSLLLSQGIAERVLFSDRFAEEYIIVYNRYINIVEQRISYYRIHAPYIVAQRISAYLESGSKYYSFWCALNRLFDVHFSYLYELFLFFFCMLLLDAMEENEYSELGARYRSMDNSHTNISAILDSLIIRYHKLRQETITRELIEIITAAESIISG